MLRAYSRWHTAIVRNGLVANESFLFPDKNPEVLTPGSITSIPVFKDAFYSDPICFTTPSPPLHTHKHNTTPLRAPFIHASLKFPSLNKRLGWGRMKLGNEGPKSLKKEKE